MVAASTQAVALISYKLISEYYTIIKAADWFCSRAMFGVQIAAKHTKPMAIFQALLFLGEHSRAGSDSWYTSLPNAWVGVACLRGFYAQG